MILSEKVLLLILGPTPLHSLYFMWGKLVLIVSHYVKYHNLYTIRQLEKYTECYKSLKGLRTLEWKPHLGTVQVSNLLL